MQIPLTPLRFLERSAKYFPQKTALICGDDEYSYKEFNERVNRTANLFKSITGKQGRKSNKDEPPSRVAYIAWNCHRVIEAAFGALRACVIRVPVNVRLTPKDWAFILNDVTAEALVIDAEFLEQLLSVKDELSTVKKFLVMNMENDLPLPDGFLDYDTELMKHSNDFSIDALNRYTENDPVEIFYTSGTTGPPKGVMLSSRNLYINAVNFFMTLNLTERDRFLHALTLFHVNGWGSPHFMTACGGTQVIMRKFSPGEFCRLVEKHKITITSLVPTMQNLLAHYPDLKNYDLGSLRMIESGGAKLHIALGLETEAALKCSIFGSYGLTEASPVLTFASKFPDLDDTSDESRMVHYRKKFCAGIEALDCMLRVVNEMGDDVPCDGTTIGEIHAKSNVITMGYWGREKETKDAFTEDGWFITGDLAVVDPDGCVNIVDRKKDLIIRGGENISSLEIEDVLRSHPSVAEAAVIPVPSDKWGEEPLAVVVLNESYEPNEDELLDLCRNELAKFKVPVGARFLDELPKSGTGKILKRELRKKFN